MILSSLFIQIWLLIILFILFRKQVFAYTGILFFLMMFVYHGLPEILTFLFPDYNSYRDLVPDDSIINKTVILFSLSMVLYIISYLSCLQISFKFNSEILSKTEKFFKDNQKSLIILASICYLIEIYYQAEGLLSEIEVSPEYWIVGLTRYFGGMLYLLALISLILMRNRFFPLTVVIGIQIMFGLASTSRSGILFTILITLIFVQHFGFTLRKKTMLTLFLVAFIFMSLISITRGIESREYIVEQSRMARLALFMQAPAMSSIELIWESLLTDFVYRFDGNSLNALIYDKLRQGFEPVLFKPLLIDLSLQIPRALSVSKLDSDIMDRDAKAYIFSHFGYDLEVDYLQGWLGYFLACFGIYGLLFSMIILGFMMASLDNWFIRTPSFLGIVVYFIVINNIIFYESTPSGLIGFLRTFITIFLIFFIKELIYAKLKSYHSNGANSQSLPAS